MEEFFYVEQKKSLNLIKIEHSKGLVNGPTILSKKIDQKPPKLKYGEVIVFNPFILHGNIGFKSKLARIACSTRFQKYKRVAHAKIVISLNIINLINY